MNTSYDVLGVPQSANKETIKAAFHRAAKAYHPDLNAGDPAAEEKLKQVIDAYHILKCPEQRAAYDLALSLRDAFNAMVKDTDSIADRNLRRALARRFANAAFVGLASGGVMALAVWLSVSLSHKQVASAPAAPLTSLATEWKRVAASGDPRAIWAFAVRNPDTPQSALARSRLIEQIEAVEDVPLLNVLRLVASPAVAERARERLIQLGTLAIKADGSAANAPPYYSVSHALPSEAIEVVGREEPAVHEPESVTIKAAAPAVQEPEGVTTQVALREKPVLQEPEGDTNKAVGREVPATQKRTRMPATALKHLAKGPDPVQPVTAENRNSALFGVGF
jgi:DnaJ domain